MSFGRFFLVEPLKSTVMAFIQQPSSVDRQPHLPHGFEGHIAGQDRSLEQ
jgi:hypothetical protein